MQLFGFHAPRGNDRYWAYKAVLRRTGAIVEVGVEVGRGQIHELEHVLDAVLPVADPLVAGAVRPQRRHGPPELVQRQADPALRLVHLVEQSQSGNGHARDVDPQMVLHVRTVPPRLPPGRRLEHGRGPFDQRFTNPPFCRPIQVLIAPVIDQSQTKKLVTGCQIHTVDALQAPSLVVAGSNRPLARGVAIPFLAGQNMGHRQYGHGVAHLALPELLIATVAVVEDVGRRPAANGAIRLRLELLPHSGVRGLDRFAELRDPLARQVDPGMDASHLFQGRRHRLQPIRLPEGVADHRLRR